MIEKKYDKAGRDTLVLGDCLDVLGTIPSNSIDLIVTSPPYAEARKWAYNSPPASGYVEWFYPMGEELLRVLSPTGSFILNIKERVDNGQKQTYVLDLILALKRGIGWRWVEEYIWYKTNPFPGMWPHKLKDGWERLLHFSKTPDLKFYRDRVKQPIREATIQGNESRRKSVKAYEIGGTGSKRTINTTTIIKDLALPSNVLVGAVASSDAKGKKHPAVMPKWITAWFIRLMSDEGDMVLDPFCGSGTTLLAAKELNRHYIGIDLEEDYLRIAEERLTQ